ncbi:Integrin alpha-D [Microtus ochrogaster]|uniref:Integrin alpha-D n=1 Tax=Microtus ochrogaster TaxID=79684 RepID=A0A8J6GPP9_MICOH|nr:Integrin alpha-D [Microtus ochrogaster]
MALPESPILQGFPFTKLHVQRYREEIAEASRWAERLDSTFLGPGVLQVLTSVLASCDGSNLDVEKPTVFREDAAGFGQTVLQFGGSRLVVGAPLEVVAVNQTGQLYDCAPATGTCQPILLPTPLEAVNMSLGLSLVAATNHSQLLACGPTVKRACAKNMYAKGSCLLLGSSLQFIQAVPATLPECPVQEMDIVFLIDGSGSIDQSDFSQMKAFVKTLMGQFVSTNTSFSLMQYSNILKTHFTFTTFRSSSNPQSLVDSIVQLQGLTFTATAIQEVVKELFHSKNGARKNAKKILIVITDGQKYRDPMQYSDVIPEAEKAKITRYAIGVGDAFQEPSALQELNTIGSAPPQDHVFKVNNFVALGSIQKQLQEKIFTIEGTQSGTSSSFQHEMSQEGFSAAFTMDGPVLGAVGSFSWSGGAFLYPQNMRPTFISMSQENVDMRDAYLGYSTALAFRKGVYSLVLGAPRHQHTGKVVIFTQESRQWRPKSEVSGTQIGSYFGASLCSVDMDGDGSTDLVLIGAPHYYEKPRGGQVSVCPMPGGRSRWQCEATLHGEQGHPWGRFGAALTVLGDVNGDRVTDVAIGAPGEEENMGAVYIFHGASKLDVNPSPSQDCVEDVVSPIILRLDFSLVGDSASSGKLCPVLAVGSQDHVTASACPSLLSLQMLVVGSSPELTVTVTVWNEGEDSYGTVIKFYYPAGLSYRRIMEIQQPHQRPLRLACETESTDQENLRCSSCSINHPIFREGAKSTFIITFDVSYKAFLGDRLLMRAEASSENNKPESNTTAFQLELPVNNLGSWKLAVSVHFWVPILLNGVAVWEVAVTTSPKDCSIADCLHFRCDIPSLGIQDELDFILKGNLSFGWVSQTLQKKVVVLSVAEVTFDTSVYSQLPGQEAFLRAQVETILEEFEVYEPISLIVGSSAGGLLVLALITAVLYKLGFFKRRYKEMLDGKPGAPAAAGEADNSCETPHLLPS